MHLSSNSIIKTTHYNYSKIFSNPINIGYGIDDNFARCTATSIFSFYKNNPNKNFIFHILENNLSNTYKEKFHLLAKKYSLNIIIYTINIDILKNLPSNITFTTAMYFRYMFPYILKNNEKIIYIDGDTLCLNNAEELFNIDLENNIIAAVPDLKWANKTRNEALSLKNHIYFNSGMLLINAKKWNEFNTFDKLINHLSTEQEKFLFPDQDALNLVLTGKVKYIDTKFNWAKVENISIDNINNIIILHYAASPKPWFLAWSVNPKANDTNRYIYKSYEQETPYSNMPLIKPRTYKEMEHYAKNLKKHGIYLSSFKWYLKYLYKKLFQ